MQYNRDKDCECQKAKKWREGWIYDDGKAKECTCHKTWRLNETLEQFFTKVPLLRQMGSEQYIGTKSKKNYELLIDHLLGNEKLKGKVIYVYGAHNTQKTYTMAKLIKKALVKELGVSYRTALDLLRELEKEKATWFEDEVANDYNLEIIDDFNISELKDYEKDLLYKFINSFNGDYLIVVSRDTLDPHSPIYGKTIGTRLHFADEVNKTVVSAMEMNYEEYLWS